uniref:Uncharacterized protein n=1 Tax=Romanomermis culicivorax TaxID=13658 RepID=A0A915J5N2_ROMCU
MLEETKHQEKGNANNEHEHFIKKTGYTIGRFKVPKSLENPPSRKFNFLTPSIKKVLIKAVE